MERILHSVVVVLLLLQGCLGITRMEYSYSGEVYGRSFASSEIVSYFGLWGKISVDLLDEHAVVKLSDLKTTAYNCFEKDMKKHTQRVDIPEAASVLLEPFVIYYEGDLISGMGFPLNEPLWSRNMKRGIGSILQLERETISGTSKTISENNIYGNCSVSYETETQGDMAVITKTIGDCEDSPDIKWGNLLAPSDPGYLHEVLTSKIMRKYTVDTKSEFPVNMKRIEAEALTTAKTMPTDKRHLYIHQLQDFNFLESSEVESNFDDSNISRYNVTFETVQSTEVSEHNVTKLFAQLKHYMEEYKEKIHSKSIEKYNFTRDDLFDNMYITIWNLAVNTGDDFSHLFETYLKDNEFKELFISFLPYLGTEKALNYIKELIENNRIYMPHSLHLLSLFPKYIENWNEDTLKHLEFLLKMENVENELISDSAVLSFTNVLAECFSLEQCSKNVIQNYADQFKKKLAEAEEYHDRMTYMLALANIAPALDEDYILPLITNQHEHSQIRTLATYAFKYALHLDSEKIFTGLWPVIHNVSEPLSVRVTALDILLGLELSEQQYKTVFETFEEYWADSHEQHIYNYFYTSTLHMHNDTKYGGHEIKLPQTFKAVSTGLYGAGYSGPEDEYGGDFDTRVIGNPKTNYIDTVILSANRYAMTLNLGEFTLYMRFEGIFDSLLEEFLNGRVNSDTPVPELLDLLRKHHFEMKHVANVSMDVALFSDNRAYFAAHIDKASFWRLFYSMLNYFLSDEVFSQPVWNWNNMPSDLGTTIGFENLASEFMYNYEEQDGDSDFEIIYESISTAHLYCVNPVNNLTISTQDVKSFKFNIAFPLSFNATDHFLTWQNENVTFHMTIDYAVATSVDSKDILRQYCDDCEEYFQIVPEKSKSGKIPLKIFGTALQYDLQYAGYQPVNVEEILENTKVTINMLSLLPPYTHIFSLLDHLYYLPPVELLSFSLKTEPLYDEPTESIVEFSEVRDMLQQGKFRLSVPDEGLSVAYTNKKIRDGTVLRHWNLSTSVQPEVEADDSHKLHQHFGIYVDDTNEEGYTMKVCLDGKVTHSHARAELYSLQASDPSEVELTLASGVDCSKENIFEEILLTLSVTDEQKEYVRSLPEYEICLKQSTGLKFTPPTKECIKISHILSQYRQYDINLLHKPKKSVLASRKLVFKHNLTESDLERTKRLNASFIFNIGDHNIKLLYKDLEDTEEYEEYVANLLLVDSFDRWRYDETIKWGLQSDCTITPKYIRTFSGKELTQYEDNTNKKLVAFVECMNNTRSALQFTRLDDHYLAFKLWVAESVITGTISNEKVQVVVDDKLVKAGTKFEKGQLSVNMLGNDAVYINSEYVDVYYNAEYIFVKILSNYKNYLCGLCTGQH